MIWFTADDHFGHAPKQNGAGGIIMHAKRPFKTIEEHDAFLIKAWNDVVSKGDLVFVLGDFAWRNHNHYVQALNGKKILITGSHDKMSQIKLASFTEIHEGMLVRTMEDIPFVLTHCAMRVWERSHYNSVNLYGHSHGRLPEYDNSRQMDVGVDVHPNYAPFSIDLIKYKMGLKVEKTNYRTQEELDAEVKKNRDDNGNLMLKFEKERSNHA